MPVDSSAVVISIVGNSNESNLILNSTSSNVNDENGVDQAFKVSINAHLDVLDASVNGLKQSVVALQSRDTLFDLSMASLVAKDASFVSQIAANVAADSSVALRVTNIENLDASQNTRLGVLETSTARLLALPSIYNEVDDFTGVYIGEFEPFVLNNDMIITKSLNVDEYNVWTTNAVISNVNSFTKSAYVFRKTKDSSLNVIYNFGLDASSSNILYTFSLVKTGLYAPSKLMMSRDINSVTVFTVRIILFRVLSPSNFSVNWFNDVITAYSSKIFYNSVNTENLYNNKELWDYYKNTLMKNNSIETKVIDVYTGDTYRVNRNKKTQNALQILHNKLGYDGITYKYSDCSLSQYKTYGDASGRLIQVNYKIPREMFNRDTLRVNYYSKIKISGTNTPLDNVPYFKVSRIMKNQGICQVGMDDDDDSNIFTFTLRTPLKVQQSSFTITLTKTGKPAITIPITFSETYTYALDMIENINNQIKNYTYEELDFNLVANTTEAQRTNPALLTAIQKANLNLTYYYIKKTTLYDISITNQSGDLYSLLKIPDTLTVTTNFSDKTKLMTAIVFPPSIIKCGDNPQLFTPFSEISQNPATLTFTHGPAIYSDPNDFLACVMDFLIDNRQEEHARFEERYISTGFGETDCYTDWTTQRLKATQDVISRATRLYPLDGVRFATSFMLGVPKFWTSDTGYPLETNFGVGGGNLQSLIGTSKVTALINSDVSGGYLYKNYLIDGGYICYKTKDSSYNKVLLSAYSTLNQASVSGIMSGGITFGVIKPGVLAKFDMSKNIGVISYRSMGVLDDQRNDNVITAIVKVIYPYFDQFNIKNVIIDVRYNSGGSATLHWLGYGNSNPKSRVNSTPILNKGNLFAGNAYITNSANANKFLASNPTLSTFFDISGVKSDISDQTWTDTDGQVYNINQYTNVVGFKDGTVESPIEISYLMNATSFSMPNVLTIHIACGRDISSQSFKLLNSNVNCQIVGCKPTICGTGGSFFNNNSNNVDPDNLISPDYRGEFSIGIVNGQQLDDSFGDHNKVDALIKGDKFEMFCAGTGIDTTLYGGRFTGIDINNAATYRDLEFELSILTTVKGGAFTYNGNKEYYTIDKLPATMF